jgi:GNAT superfamily N-acetyltransferase
MEIITYRELKNKDAFMFLIDLAFWWPISPADMEKVINLDIRLKNGPVGFCAVENGKLAGFVGVLDIPTKTVSGKEEMVGGIWCVATSPSFARRGICKMLMDKAHRYFKDKRCPFSFLQTSRTLIAYAIYVKMEYVEIEKVNRYPEAYKVFQKDQVEKKPETRLDPEKIRGIYQEFVKDRTGFVIRQKDFVRMFSQRRRFEEKKSFQQENGYALLFESSNVIKIQELISRDDVTFNKLLDQVEAAARNGVIDRMITDEKLLKIYKSRGYCIYEEGDHGVFMVKKLADIDFQEVYGEAFHIGILDLF